MYQRMSLHLDMIGLLGYGTVVGIDLSRPFGNHEWERTWETVRYPPMAVIAKRT